MSKKSAAPPIWFKNVRQVYQYLTCPIGEEFIHGEGTSIKEAGLVYQVSEKTIYNHVDDKDGMEKLKRNRKRCFSRQTVDRYAKTHLAKVVGDADPAEESEEQPTASQSSAARRVEMDARVKEADAKLKEVRLKEIMGQMCPTANIERELGERFQGVKLYFSSFMRDNAPEFLSALGGDLQVAKEMIALVGGDDDKSEALSGFVFSRKPLLVDVWKRSLTDALNNFAMGTWFTDEMRDAWVAYEASRRESEAAVAAELLAIVGGDENKLGTVLSRFDIRIREA